MKIKNILFLYTFLILSSTFLIFYFILYKDINSSIFIKLIIGYIFTLLLAFYISYIISKNIKEKSKKIKENIKNIYKKEYEKLTEVDFIEELEKIDLELKKLAKKLKNKDEKTKEYTKKIKQISRQRSELISAISHEFKNPIAIIDGYAQTLLDEKDLDEKLRDKFIQKIYNASQKISNMIDRLSIAIKFENNDLKPKKSRFNICEVIEDVVKLMKDKYKNREILVKCNSYEVFADKIMIEMVLVNLIDNALKYSEMEVKVIQKDGEIKVIDRGIGIKEEDIKKITKKFYRARKNSWDNSMGLGLYLVSYILELHNSKLQIDSTFNKGSTFSFKL